MYLKYFLESGILAQDSKDSESRTLFYFVTDPSRRAIWQRETIDLQVPGGYKFMVKPIIYIDSEIVYEEYNV